MKKDERITLEAVGEFPFTFYIEKANPIDEGDELILEGIASTTNVDHDKERMSKDALRAMEAMINKEGVPLRVEHQKDGAAVIGRVYKAWVDDRNQLRVRARLDKSHPVSPILHSSMKQGVKMGLSVGGLVKRAVKEFSESVGGMVKTFYDVALQEVSVTPRPANYDSWLIAKSIAKDTQEAELYGENEALRREFLFENSQLDYLQAFAKSVPDKAWRKVDSSVLNKEQNNNNMEKDIEKKEEKTEETEKTVSVEQFNALSKAFKDLTQLVSKGFENVGKAMAKAMDGSAKETTNPDKTKEQEAEQQTAKMESAAMDQNNPDKKKPDDESPAAKSSEKDETKEKSSEKEETEKKEKTDDYDLETVNRAIKSMDALTARVKKTEDKKDDETEKAEDKEETEKAEDDKKEETEKAEDETEATKAAHPLDLFVASVTKAMEAVVERMEKSGKRVLGFEKSIADTIKNDPAMQTELMKLLKMPGFKKSVAMGVPYMITKDGRRIALMNAPEQVEKSEKPAGSFKDLYKTKYSSVSPNETNE